MQKEGGHCKMGTVRRSTMAALRAAGLNGDFTIEDLRTGTILQCRGAAGNNNHVDFQWKTKSVFHTVLTLLRIALTAIVGNWRARPGILRFKNNTGSYAFAIAYHTYNHSVGVASNAFNPVPYRVIRGRGEIPHEQTATGDWRPGEHCCMWTEDSYVLRGSRTAAWEREMRDAVIEAERQVGTPITATAPPATSAPQPESIPQDTPMWRVQVVATRERADAERIVNQLIQAGHYAYLNNYNGWYRAQAGVFATKAEADALARTLRNQGFDTFVKQR